MKVKFLKMFRKRFTIQYNPSHFFPVSLIDHKLKKVNPYSSIDYAVCYAVSSILGFKAWRKRYDRIEQRNDRNQYYKAYFKTNI